MKELFLEMQQAMMQGVEINRLQRERMQSNHYHETKKSKEPKTKKNEKRT